MFAGGFTGLAGNNDGIAENDVEGNEFAFVKRFITDDGDAGIDPELIKCDNQSFGFVPLFCKYVFILYRNENRPLKN